MKNFKIQFTGKQKNAIGKSYKITETVEAENIDNAKLKLYDNYEHIHVLKVNNKVVDKDYTFNEFR
jgi:hypothetical protein